ncbi:hypothetical protein BD833_12412 [Blastococcus xanthinilyticus]|uniref:RibD domain-containing protein n=1 Tax=Blastococcus xanthinilyticus TaxID=1564164 RepID=A0A5S5CN77_9ACTN|nr:hypothetical protein BD833_12412 [Blastococcus xanthinilyticus]
MAKLIYSMVTSLDGYAEAAEGDLGFAGAQDEEVHTFISGATPRRRARRGRCGPRGPLRRRRGRR